MNEHALGVAASGILAATSGAAAINGDDITALVVLGINIVVLISNAAIAIYRQWRDRDSDKGGKNGRERDDE